MYINTYVLIYLYICTYVYVYVFVYVYMDKHIVMHGSINVHRDISGQTAMTRTVRAKRELATWCKGKAIGTMNEKDDRCPIVSEVGFK